MKYKRPDLRLCTLYICLTPSNGSPVDQICDWEVVKLAVCFLKNIFPIVLLQVKLACQGFLVTRTASKKVRNLRTRAARLLLKGLPPRSAEVKSFLTKSGDAKGVHLFHLWAQVKYRSHLSPHQLRISHLPPPDLIFWRNPSRRRQCHRTALQGQGYREKERKPTLSHILQPLGCRKPTSQKLLKPCNIRHRTD